MVTQQTSSASIPGQYTRACIHAAMAASVLVFLQIIPDYHAGISLVIAAFCAGACIISLIDCEEYTQVRMMKFFATAMQFFIKVAFVCAIFALWRVYFIPA